MPFLYFCKFLHAVFLRSLNIWHVFLTICYLWHAQPSAFLLFSRCPITRIGTAFLLVTVLKAILLFFQQFFTYISRKMGKEFLTFPSHFHAHHKSRPKTGQMGKDCFKKASYCLHFASKLSYTITILRGNKK